MRLIESLSQNRVVVTTGTGGVGKTTVSCSMAIALAHSKNAKVLVITIDPAKRLGTVLSEQNLGHEPKKIDHSKFFDNKIDVKGELYGVTVDMSKGWDELINRFADSKEDATKILQNTMYQNLTTRFTHSHDFIAMDQLYEYYYRGEYDYIILDTPPMSQALDFFDAPKIISEFFGGKIIGLVTSPYRLSQTSKRAKIFDIASKPFFTIANKVLGETFLNDIGEFFYLFKKIYSPLVQRANDINEFLKSDSLGCTYIMNPLQYIEKDYEIVLSKLSSRSLKISNMVINMLPFSDSDATLVKDYIESSKNELLNKAMSEYLEKELEIVQEVQNRLNMGSTGFTNSDNSINDYQLEVFLVPKSYEIDLSMRLTYLVDLVLESMSANKD